MLKITYNQVFFFNDLIYGYFDEVYRLRDIHFVALQTIHILSS